MFEIIKSRRKLKLRQHRIENFQSDTFARESLPCRLFVIIAEFGPTVLKAKIVRTVIRLSRFKIGLESRQPHKARTAHSCTGRAPEVFENYVVLNRKTSRALSKAPINLALAKIPLLFVGHSAISEEKN